MKALFAAVFVTVLVLFRPAFAQQDVVWVQIEAQPSLSQAQEAAQRYALNLPDVNGFSIGSGWYGIVLGPYTRADAEQVLRAYRADGDIPRDSYIQFSSRLGAQFWPVGANVLGRGAVTAPLPQEQAAVTATEEPAQQITPADETPAEARRSESLLTRGEREALQIALQWAGFYNAAIDGAFGRGTRASMAAWQAQKGYEQTGILTTSQRAELLADYNAPLTSVGMAMLADTDAGIEMLMPMDEVRFTRIEPPFAHYDSAGALGARVILISQPGSQATLFGLYEIMQTLEIVPLDGPRQRGSSSFTLEGRNDRIVSYTEAALQDGEIKGFTLVWPTGDEARRIRVLDEMKASFKRIDGVLDPAAGADSEQSIDLVSGLEIRKPLVARSGFFIDGRGTVITTSEVLRNCGRITVENDIPAEIVAQDSDLGVAVLKPSAPLAPISVAQFRASPPRLQSDIAVAGYSYGGVLGAPSLTYGTLSDVKGLRGETELKRLALAAQPGDAGGPVLDTGGTVLGMLLPRPASGPQLPGDVSFAANAQAIGTVLAQAGLGNASTAEPATMTPTELGRMASGMTVLVSCWE
jgi:S1-C subfamily serine protease